MLRAPHLQAIVLLLVFEPLAAKECCHLPLKLVGGHHSLEQRPHVAGNNLLTVTQDTLDSSLGRVRHTGRHAGVTASTRCRQATHRCVCGHLLTATIRLRRDCIACPAAR